MITYNIFQKCCVKLILTQFQYINKQTILYQKEETETVIPTVSDSEDI